MFLLCRIILPCSFQLTWYLFSTKEISFSTWKILSSLLGVISLFFFENMSIWKMFNLNEKQHHDQLTNSPPIPNNSINSNTHPRQATPSSFFSLAQPFLPSSPPPLKRTHQLCIPMRWSAFLFWIPSSSVRRHIHLQNREPRPHPSPPPLRPISLAAGPPSPSLSYFFDCGESFPKFG